MDKRCKEYYLNDSPQVIQDSRNFGLSWVDIYLIFKKYQLITKDKKFPTYVVICNCWMFRIHI